MMFLNAPETWCQHDKPYDSCRHCELEAAVEELVTAVEGLAHRDDTEYLLASPANAERLQRSIGWTVDPHHETTDTLTVEAAADRLEERLGE